MQFLSPLQMNRTKEQNFLFSTNLHRRSYHKLHAKYSHLFSKYFGSVDKNREVFQDIRRARNLEVNCSVDRERLRNKSLLSDSLFRFKQVKLSRL